MSTDHAGVCGCVFVARTELIITITWLLCRDRRKITTFASLQTDPTWSYFVPGTNFSLTNAEKNICRHIWKLLLIVPPTSEAFSGWSGWRKCAPWEWRDGRVGSQSDLAAKIQQPSGLSVKAGMRYKWHSKTVKFEYQKPSGWRRSPLSSCRSVPWNNTKNLSLLWRVVFPSSSQKLGHGLTHSGLLRSNCLQNTTRAI